MQATESFMNNIEIFEELLFRSLHRSLLSCEGVLFVELGKVRTPSWLINASDAKHIQHTHAADRETRVLPEHSVPSLHLQWHTGELYGHEDHRTSVVSKPRGNKVNSKGIPWLHRSSSALDWLAFDHVCGEKSDGSMLGEGNP